MKVITLDNRHRTFKYGFTHAIRFGNGENTNNYYKLIKYLEERYPRPTGNYYSWPSAYYIKYGGKWEPIASAGHWKKRIHWICVKNESLLTMALMAIDVE